MNFEAWVVENESTVRLSFFIGIFLAVALWELLSPRRLLLLSRWLRWSNNLALVALNTAILRLLFPLAAVGVAATAATEGWGLLNHTDLSAEITILIAVVVMDFVIWLQHVMVHAIPLLWRLHRVHHADLDYDVTTGARFHPIEIVLSMLIKIATILLLGPPVVAVILFEVILNAMAMFNHGNIRLPETMDRVLRTLVVTPDMHRVHHSIEEDEANTNFGFNLSCWDRLLGTYRAEPRQGQEGMVIGVEGMNQQAKTNQLIGMLLLPFSRQANPFVRYTINRRRRNREI
ncbi:MAG: sterol desaturase family protein [Gammaproteobacteria bacterium]|jgi:sterol desaturase/sphingolipid hydroxylase (fatty acid hydroxylase superfamily)|nr:sterol desaturase family protein [Gammaproteobacteria bacterium]MBT7308066.1 sterol desaturase family protein [Gammaproteobacteria bacterium]